MASFRFGRVPSGKLAIDDIRTVVEEWSVRNGNDKSGQGTIPETLNVPGQGTAYFKYGKWRTEKIEQLDGVTQVPECEKRLMGVLNEDLFFVQTARTNEYRESMEDMFEREFTRDIVLKTKEFNSSAMRLAEAEADTLLEARFVPDDRMEPDSVTIEDRGDVRGSNAYDRHEDQDRDRLKMELNPGDRTLIQGFKQHGTFTIYHRDLQSDQIVGILRANYQLLCRMLEESASVQYSWSNWGTDEGSDSEGSESDD